MKRQGKRKARAASAARSMDIDGISTAQRDEGIKDAEQILDIIHDYNALAEQYRKMRQRYEEAAKVLRFGNAFLCPACNRQIRQLSAVHCWNCGKMLDWNRR